MQQRSTVNVDQPRLNAAEKPHAGRVAQRSNEGRIIRFVSAARMHNRNFRGFESSPQLMKLLDTLLLGGTIGRWNQHQAGFRSTGHANKLLAHWIDEHTPG